MSILKANLRHFYQHRGYRLYYLLSALFVYQTCQFSERRPYLIWVWHMMNNFMLGLAVGMLQREILSKGFVYCLPGRRPVPRRVMGLAGVTLNAGLCLVVLIHPHITAVQIPLVMLSVFSLGLAIFLFSARCMFTLSDKMVPLIPIYGILVVLMFVKGAVLDRVILARPELIAAASLSVGVALWANLRHAIDPRVFCGQRVQSFSDFGRAGIKRNRQVREAAHGIDPGMPAPVEAVFFGRIEAAGPLSTARCIWGDLYATFAVLFPLLKTMLSVCLPMAGFLASVAGKGGPDEAGHFAAKFPALSGAMLLQVVLVVSLIPIVQVPIPVFSNMLLTRGRRERFRATISVALALALLVSCLLLYVAAFTAVLQLVAPNVFGSLMRLLGGPLTLAYLAAPFALVPLALAVRLVRRYFDMEILYSLVFCLVVLGLTVRHWYAQIGMPLLLVTTVCCWAALALAAHRICSSRSFAR